MLHLDLGDTPKPIGINLISILRAWMQHQVFMFISKPYLHADSWSIGDKWPSHTTDHAGVWLDLINRLNM